MITAKIVTKWADYMIDAHKQVLSAGLDQFEVDRAVSRHIKAVNRLYDEPEMMACVKAVLRHKGAGDCLSLSY